VQEAYRDASSTAQALKTQQHLALESSAMSITLSDLGDSAGTLSIEASTNLSTAGVLAVFYLLSLAQHATLLSCSNAWQTLLVVILTLPV
jgi:hypothetical protein